MKVIVEDQQLPPFRYGQRVPLLLSRPGPSNAYEIVEGPFGAFVLEVDDRVRPVLRVIGLYDDMSSLTRTEFAERLRRVRRR